MLAVIQRARKASVKVNCQTVGQIEFGLVILLGVFRDDDQADADFLAQKITGLRIFPDAEDKMNRSILEVGGQALVISQFTLCGDWRKGRRPSFINAASPELGAKLYHYFTEQLAKHGVPTQQGVFGAMMDVQLINAGPVTFVLDSRLK